MFHAKKFLKHSARLLAALISILIIWLSVSSGPSSNVLARIEYLFYDLRFNLLLPYTKRGPSEHNIAIIDIDEDSIVSEGRFPWSRHKIAKLVDKLGEAGVLVTAFDVVFSEAEVNPVDYIGQLVAKPLIEKINPQHWQKIAHSVDADSHLAKSLTEQDVVLGFFFQDDKKYRNGQLPPSIFEIPLEWGNRLVVTDRPGFTANIPVLQDSATGGGFVTMFPDFDGAVRRAPLVIQQDGQLYPSLALSAAMRYLFIDNIEPKVAEMGNVLTVTDIAVSEFPAPTDASGFVRVPYQGKAFSYPYISASDVLNDRLEPGILEGAVVFVGTSAIGLADLRSTPMGPQYPGVEVHANILGALLSGGFPYQPYWTAGALFLQLVLIAVFMIIVLPMLGPSAMLATGTGIIVLVSVFNSYAWVLGLDLPLAGAWLLTVSLTAAFVADGFLRENASKKMLKGMFDQYVPPAHIDQMMANPEAYTFDGDSKELTVLFADIRSFTTISESLTAKELKRFLNNFFTPITKEIFDQQGTIDKYVGDMVMAFWGAPIDDGNHRNHAILAAINMQIISQELKIKFKEMGLPEASIGVGLNTGPMNVGDMGSSYRRSYTVLGDAVNLGSRLESITKFYGSEILIGEDTYDHSSGFVCRFVDRIQVKGKDTAIRVYEPLGQEGKVTQAQLDELKEYEIAYQLHLDRKWNEAHCAFTALFDKTPLGVYKVYLERIPLLKEQTLPDDWNGTFRHTSK
jgi:adenylate cyclase